jgi:hypothetical protein
MGDGGIQDLFDRIRGMVNDLYEMVGAAEAARMTAVSALLEAEAEIARLKIERDDLLRYRTRLLAGDDNA